MLLFLWDTTMFFLFLFLIFNFLSSLKESSFILGEANLYFLRDQTLKKKI